QPQNAQESQVDVDKEVEVSGQDGQQINDGAAAGDPLPACLPSGLLWLFFDYAPEAQDVFRRKNDDGNILEKIKKPLVGFVDVVDGFQQDRNDIANDQGNQQVVEGLA